VIAVRPDRVVYAAGDEHRALPGPPPLCHP
jgi:hypothetical protein